MKERFKKVTNITLRNGQTLTVPRREGDSAKQAKAKGKGAIVFPSLNNRMIDVTYIVDIQDKGIPIAETDEGKLLAEGEHQFDPNSPGYQAFLKAKERLAKKKSL